MIAGAMNFTRENRKAVFDFFTNILSTYYTEPVYYEYIRGHASKAPEVVKQYILKKCKGSNLLEYFGRRKNYFDVEGTKISLRKEPRTTGSPENTSIKKKKFWRTKFYPKRSEDHSIKDSDIQRSSNVSENQLSTSEKLVHEDYVRKHFTRLLEGNKVVKIESIDFESLPKKVIRHLSLYCNKSVINYFSKFPDTFVIDDNRNVYLSDKTNICTDSNIKYKTHLVIRENEETIFISSEVRSAYIWLESIEFFLGILKKKKTNFVQVDKLASYLSQADESVRTFLKSYKPFKTFFSGAPLVFSLNGDEVSMSYHYNNVLKLAKRRIRCALEGSFHESGMSLTSYLHELVSKHSSEDELDEDQKSESKTDFELDEEGELEKSEQSDKEDLLKIFEQSEDENVEQSEDENVEQSEDENVEQSEEESVKQSEDKDVEQSEDKNVEQIEEENIEQNEDKNVEQIEEENVEQSNKGTFENGTNLNQCDEGEMKGKDINGPEHKVLTSTSSKDNVHNDIKLNRTNNSDESDAKFLQFLYTVQLFCAETVENEIHYSSRHKIKAIEFFVDILKASSQTFSLTSLHGTLGLAPPDIISFVNKMYKGEKFSLFFQEHEEFVLKSSFVSLASTYNDSFQKRLDLFSKYKHEFCFEDLYESNRYKIVLKETFALFFKVYQHLINCNKMKLNRLYNIVLHFPDCLEWIKSSNGKTQHEQMKTLFQFVNIFQFSDEGFVSFASEKNYDILTKWLEQMSEAFYNSKLEMPVFKLKKDNNNTCRKVLFNCEKDCFWSLVEFFESIKNVLKDVNHSHYYELVGILPKELLFKIAQTNNDSRIIISALLKNGQFLVKNGTITVSEGKHNFTDIKSQKPVNSIWGNETDVITSPDNYIPVNGGNSSLNIPFCEPKVNIKEEINKTDSSFKHGYNISDENHILLKPNSNVKGVLGEDPGNDSAIQQNLDQSEMLRGYLNKDLINSNKTIEDHENANTVLSVSNTNLGTDSFCNLRKTENSAFQNLYSDEIEQPIDETSNPDYQCPIIDWGKDRMSFKNGESLPENPTLSTTNTVDSESQNHISSFAAIQNDNLNTIFTEEYQNSTSRKLIRDHCDSTELSEDFSPNTKSIEAVTDFDTEDINPEVSATQLLDLGEKEKLFTQNYIEFYKQTDPSLSSNEDLGYNEECNDNKSRSVVENEPESTWSVLFEEDQTDAEVHSDKKDKDFKIEKSSLNNALESSKIFHARECKRSTQTNMCEKDGTSAHFKTVCGENEISVMDQNVKIISNTELTNVEMKNINKNHSEILISDDISKMKYKANCLAREVFIKMGTCEKVFVASSNFVFYFKRGDNFCMKKDSNVIVENSLNFGNPSPKIKDDNFEELGTLWPSNLVPSTSTDDNSLEKGNLNKNVDVTENDDSSFKYPLQPINAKIILLTVNSCIAQAEITSGKQNIYFLKCVFSCEEDNCCSDCFDDLCIGDCVSCFVPITEMSCKMWIAIMVSKEESKNFKRTDHINQVLQIQTKNGFDRQCQVDIQIPCKKHNSENISVQTEYLCSEQECQIEILGEEVFCQTDLSGDVQMKFATSEVMCQTSSVLVQDVSLQIGCTTSSSYCQTDISCVNTSCVECQTNLSGEVKESVPIADNSSQTITTGSVMAIEYYHF